VAAPEASISLKDAQYILGLLGDYLRCLLAAGCASTSLTRRVDVLFAEFMTKDDAKSPGVSA
jgi:hypothetical protein